MSNILNSIWEQFNPLKEDDEAATQSLTLNLHQAQKALQKAKHEVAALRC